MQRCAWATSELGVIYHDRQWGVPVHDDRMLFEMLIVEGAQAGLSWETILNKRESYRAAFDHFDPASVANNGQKKRRNLLSDAGIVRNRLKIEAAIQNAQMFLAVQQEFGTFDEYIWGFVGTTICYAFMQAVGMVNDHLVGCFRYAEVRRPRAST